MSTSEGFRLDHVGIVVRELGPWLDRFGRILRVDPAVAQISTVRDPESGELVEAAFLTVGANRLEFICPRPGSRSRFARHLEAHGEGLFHLSLYVEQFEEEVDAWRSEGAPVDTLTVRMTSPTDDPDAPPERVVDIAWLPPADTGGVNVELVDANPRPPDGPVG